MCIICAAWQRRNKGDLVGSIWSVRVWVRNAHTQQSPAIQWVVYRTHIVCYYFDPLIVSSSAFIRDNYVRWQKGPSCNKNRGLYNDRRTVEMKINKWHGRAKSSAHTKSINGRKSKTCICVSHSSSFIWIKNKLNLIRRRWRKISSVQTTARKMLIGLSTNSHRRRSVVIILLLFVRLFSLIFHLFKAPVFSVMGSSSFLCSPSSLSGRLYYYKHIQFSLQTSFGSNKPLGMGV